MEEEIKEKIFFRGLEIGKEDRKNGKPDKGAIRKIYYLYQEIFLKGYNIGYNLKDLL